MTKKTIKNVASISTLLGQIKDAAKIEVTESILWNSLSGPELRTSQFDQDFREDVLGGFKNIVEDIALSGTTTSGAKFGTSLSSVLKTMPNANTVKDLAFANVDECLEILMSGERVWVDTQIEPGTLVTVTTPFGHMKHPSWYPFLYDLAESEAKADYVMFLGWKSELVKSKSVDEHAEEGEEPTKFRAYTQEWLVGEKTIVQNMPVTCYDVIRPGVNEGSAPFWDPTQDFE